MRRLLILAVLAACSSPKRAPIAAGADAAPPAPAAPTAPDAAPPAPLADPPGLAVHVDRRIELLSILYRLAGSKVYLKAATPYAADVDRHFAAFANHPAVEASRKLIEAKGISHDAPVTLAVYLDDELQPVRPLAEMPPGLDQRWRGVELDRYLAEVRAFAADSGFDAFRAAHADYYRAVENAFRAYLADKPIIPWFDGVFGARAGARYHVVPSLLTGGWAFGTRAVHADGATEDVVQVMFLDSPDRAGVPRPGERTLEYLAHELAHSYVNPIFDARAKRHVEATGPAYARTRPAMERQAYRDYKTMTNESVVRALTVLYLRVASTRAHADRSLAEQQRLGFLWMPALVDAVDALLGARAADPRGLPVPVDADALVDTTTRVFAEWLASTPSP